MLASGEVCPPAPLSATTNAWSGAAGLTAMAGLCWIPVAAGAASSFESQGGGAESAGADRSSAAAAPTTSTST